MSSVLKKIKVNREIEAVDIPTMNKMSDDEYRKFIQSDELIFIDHHNVLRSSIADYPIATTREQLDIFIEELQRQRGKLEAVRGDLHELEPELSLRTLKALRTAHIDRIEQLSKMTARQLLSIKDFGKRAFNEVKAALSRRGLSLVDDISDDLS
jgi:Bacterial RNA polymerase, alpha chain C terminal domain